MMAPAADPMLEGYTTLGFLAGHTETHAARSAGHRRHLPPPRSARQDRHHPRRALRRAGRARHRRRLVRARAPRPRRAVPAVGRAVRAPRGDPADLPADVERRRRPVRTAPTTSSPRPSARRRRSARPTRASSSAAAASGRRCGSSPATPTPATCSPHRPTRWPTSSTCSSSHCDTEGRDPGEIDRTILAMANPLDDPDGFVAAMADYAALGIEPSRSCPSATRSPSPPTSSTASCPLSHSSGHEQLECVRRPPI